MNTIVAFVTLAGCFAIGYALRNTKWERIIVKPLTTLLLYLVVPLAVFKGYATYGLEAFKSTSLVALAALAASITAWMFLRRRLCCDTCCSGALLFAMAFPNAVFLPMSLAPILGLDTGLIASYALPIIVVHFTVGLRLAAKDVRAYELPAMVVTAALAGLVLHALLGYNNLEALLNFISIVTLPSGYLAAIVVGASLPKLQGVMLDGFTATVLLWRLAASPLIHLLVSIPLAVDQNVFRVLLVEAPMPPATMNTVLARYLNLDAERIAYSILALTPLSILEAILLTSIF